jgi:DNA processing protein
VTAGRSASRAELAFLPRSLSNMLFPLASGGASAGRILEEAYALDPSGSWRPDASIIERETEALERTGTRIVIPGDDDYPPLLGHVAHPPMCLHVRGTLPDRGRPHVAIVGSRSSSGNSLAFTRDLARALGRAGAAVVSGMARGIDSAAHEGCIEADRKTVAVLGCGADVCYPRDNRKLMEAIVERGAVVSELPMGTSPAPFNFPARNRIISGLSRGTIVVEAGPGSGAMITAKYAAEQGRTVFAVPGAVWNPLSAGPNSLIVDGAVPVRGPDDVLQEMMGVSALRGVVRTVAAPRLGPLERAVLEALDYDEPRHVDAVAKIAKTPASRVLPALLDLEIRGMAGRMTGLRFFRVGGVARDVAQ